MADTPLLYLTGIALVLVGGILITIVANRLRISNIVGLILLGFLLGMVPKQKYPLFSFGEDFLIALAILALVMIVFDGASRFKLRDLDAHSMRGLKLVGVFLLLSSVLVTPFVLFVFPPNDWLANIVYALMFSAIICGTDPASVFVLLKSGPTKVMELLKIEAIMNTPITVLIPFLLADLLSRVRAPVEDATLFDVLAGYVQPFLMQVVVGLGVGFLVGLIVIRAMRRFYSGSLSPIALMGAALITYAIAEMLEGNGVLAVAFLGISFGNTYVREKSSMQEFSSLLSTSLEILVFVLIGVALYPLPSDLLFWLKATLLFLVLFVARLLAVIYTTRDADINPRERLFLALNMPKGIAVAVVVFKFFFSSPEPYLATLLNVVVVFMIISLVIASITDRFAETFGISAPKAAAGDQPR